MHVLLALGLAAAQATESDKGPVVATAYARIVLAQTMASDSQLVAAVVAKNRAHETREQIQARDKDWIANREYPMRKQLTGNDCARRLRELSSEDTVIVEAFLMDNQGALVCSTVETQDYWQGDEAKWTKTYTDGNKVFVDEPALDQNTATFAIQLSVPVWQGEKRIGALTLTLRVPRTAARP